MNPIIVVAGIGLTIHGGITAYAAWLLAATYQSDEIVAKITWYVIATFWWAALIYLGWTLRTGVRFG